MVKPGVRAPPPGTLAGLDDPAGSRRRRHRRRASESARDAVDRQWRRRSPGRRSSCRRAHPCWSSCTWRITVVAAGSAASFSAITSADGSPSSAGRLVRRSLEQQHVHGSLRCRGSGGSQAPVVGGKSIALGFRRVASNGRSATRERLVSEASPPVTRTPAWPIPAATKEQLILTAERLFALHGLDGVSLRQISAEAGQRQQLGGAVPLRLEGTVRPGDLRVPHPPPDAAPPVLLVHEAKKAVQSATCGPASSRTSCRSWRRRRTPTATT